MADVVNQDQVHKDGTDHIKDKVFGEGEGTATPKPEPIAAAKPPASNPGADNPSAGIAKDAGGVSVAAHVGSPSAGNKEKRKSIVGQLKGLFLGGDKKEREASEAGTAKQGESTTGAIAAGATGTGVATGQAVDLPDKTKSTTAGDSAPKSTTEQVKEAVTGDKAANTGTVAASTTEPAQTSTQPETSDTKPIEPTDTSGDSEHKPPAPAGGKPPENREAIPTAGGERLGDKHWGESKIVPDNPKAKTEESAPGVASSEGQPTDEVKDNTAKNTGGATAGPKDETPASGEKKGKFLDKVKDKLPFGKKD
ncbi:hypothetical protein M409DRAFT_56827 [Zasmidium cellare ATCC 36951]|uniref:Uncharacterized protein n=1 Tax=Zasmidium cellare ATCC 36951 TaxID=1080233 RepID=A0A6A6CAR7_ZASCE|nr:uncharacterized protein M409DRAFT_56827 [Zasmidium cellare ATCC 36951]KAF2164115.1 hypothetical protein M409DRAFT_56827 [Zasmidium cellare ATCC 36951]